MIDGWALQQEWESNSPEQFKTWLEKRHQNPEKYIGLANHNETFQRDGMRPNFAPNAVRRPARPAGPRQYFVRTGGAGAVESMRNALDDKPMPISDGSLGARSAQHEHWSGLRRRSKGRFVDFATQFPKFGQPFAAGSMDHAHQSPVCCSTSGGRAAADGSDGGGSV